jgi:hypothetical protein
VVLRRASLGDGVGGEPSLSAWVDGDEDSSDVPGKDVRGEPDTRSVIKTPGVPPQIVTSQVRDVSSHDRCRCQETKM